MGHHAPTRSVVVFVETKRALGVDEEPYSCTATIPDAGPAPVSAKNTALLSSADGWSLP